MIGQFKGRQKTNVYGWVSDLAVARSGFNQIDLLETKGRISFIAEFVLLNLGTIPMAAMLFVVIKSESQYHDLRST